MSDFFDNLVDLLPEHSALKKPDNQLRQVLDYTVGEWFDNRMDVNDFKGNLFLQTATGKWLDLFGLDYGIPRMENESDDVYRQRIIYEKLDNLTADTLTGEYGVGLYCFVSQFNAGENSLTSDNPYLSNSYMGLVDKELQDILDSKFILDTSLLWLNDDYSVDYIINQLDKDLIFNYKSIYSANDLSEYFQNNSLLKKVGLKLFNLEIAGRMFFNCAGLTDLDLYLPNLFYAKQMLNGCRSLVIVKLNMPVLEEYTDIFLDCNDIQVIDVTIPENIVDGFISYVNGLDFNNLTSFKVNGVERL